MSLSSGDKLGPSPAELMDPKPGDKFGDRFTLLLKLGSGGMGEVWKARDTELDRDVALKVSKAEFTARFKQEARAMAAFSHPNICQIHDVGPNYIVMELIDGVQLSGRLPAEKVVAHAGFILDALDAAHRKGFTHRDLKPANVMVTAKGGVKLLDFGLAKRNVRELGPDDMTGAALTKEGNITGTLQYMSPEQLNGKEADARSDIFAFGCVLYEMLSGRKAFSGSTTASVIAAIMEREPEPLQTAPPLDRVIRICLAKDPDERFQNALDLKRDLLWAVEGQSASSTPSRSRLGNTGWVVAGVMTVLLAGLSLVHFRENTPETTVIRSTILPPDKTSFGFNVEPRGVPSLSPDGRRLVFGTRSDDGVSRLWVRSLDSMTAQPLPGTEGATNSYPFWSPDGRSVGFSSEGKLKKIDLSGGPAVTLVDVSPFRGASWSPQGVILFGSNIGPLQRIPAEGGRATPATVIDPASKENSHRSPWFLPDGRHFLYSATVANTINATICVGSLDSRESRMILQANSNAVYASGHLLFLRDSTLMAQPFDAQSLMTTGEAVPIAEQVANNFARGFFSVSNSGTLVFQSGMQAGQTIAWMDRTGKRVAIAGEPGQFLLTSLSPDGKRAAVSVYDRGARNYDLWIYDLMRNLRSRFTFDPANEFEGVWSPDGSQIVFSSDRKGHSDLYRKLASGAGAEELLYSDGLSKRPTSWSPDGKFLMYYSQDPKTGYDICTLPLEGDRKPVPFLKTGFNERDGQFSPDGHWVAYSSDESGRVEIYIASFPGSGGKRQVSVAGGQYPRWRADGKELFYTAPDGRLTAVEVNMKLSEVEIGAARPLFGTLATNLAGYQYDVSADGQRILAIMPSEQAAAAPLTLVQNWMVGLKR
jgi:serine/threonine protein kinase/roadblock/LC7 domain-containing protein